MSMENMCNSHGENGPVIELNWFFKIEWENDWKVIACFC